MITLYTKPNCTYCEQSKQWLDNNNIAYESINITENQDARDFLFERGHKTVPQFYLQGELLFKGGYEGLTKQDPEILKEKIEVRKAA